jgi:hypothetical protein
MKTIYLSILLTLIFVPKSVFSQEKIELKDLGFSINYPKDWIAFNKSEVIPNIKNYDFNKDVIEAFSKQVNKSVEFITLSKYEPGKYNGIIPTIKIRVEKNTSKNIVELQKALDLGIKLNETLPNMHFVEKSNIVIINGNQIIRTIIGYTLKNNDVEYHIKSFKILIPIEKYYISLNFIEEEKKEDNSQLYEELIKSIQINPIKKD